MSIPERLNCNAVSVLISQAQDRNLSLVEQARLQAHLAICRACLNFQKQMEFLKQAIRRHPARKDEDG